MTVLLVVVGLAVAVWALDLRCWGVERYTISVSRGLPNIAPPLPDVKIDNGVRRLPSPAGDRGQGQAAA